MAAPQLWAAKRAIQAAREAHRRWSELPPDRQQQLRDDASALKTRTQSLATQMAKRGIDRSRRDPGNDPVPADGSGSLTAELQALAAATAAFAAKVAGQSGPGDSSAAMHAPMQPTAETSTKPTRSTAEADPMTTDTEQLTRLIEAAPVLNEKASVDIPGVLDAFRAAGVDPADVMAVSHCKFGTANIEALVDSDTVAFIHSNGVLCTIGKRKMFGGQPKFNEVTYAACRGFGEVEHTDDRGFGKFGIEFVGPGNVLLGRLHWSWRAKRFKDSRQAIMSVAEERDRVLAIVQSQIG